MVKMSKSAIWTTDPGGNSEGDIHAHTFLPAAPLVSERTGDLQGRAVSNSCSVCHPTDPADPVARIIDENLSDPDDDGTFHPDLPRNFQNGVANAENAAGGVACVACHTTEGFLAIQVEANDIHHLASDSADDVAERNAIVKTALGQDHGILCHACHGRDVDGVFQPDNLRFPKADLCGRCHNDETVKFADFRDHGEIVRHPQREMLAGTAGEEVSGTYTNTFHTNIANKCVECHYDENTTGHTPQHDFEPATATCGRCHSGLNTFNRPAFGDYDGDGTTEGIQDEVKGLLEVLAGALVDDTTIWRDGEYFVDADPAGAGYSQSEARQLQSAAVTDAQRRAVFNWYSVEFDASFGVHNAQRTVQLLQRSYEEVTGGPVPGAVLR
jgi:formate-dependent nitrite reductase cytochrome c552 subunit